MNEKMPQGGERIFAYVFSIGLVLAVLWPLQRQPPKDSFPLSTFPMFSKARPRFADISHVVGVDGEGERRPIPPALVANGEVLQAKVTIERTIRRGRRGAMKLCSEVAGRVAEAGDEFADVGKIEVRGDRYLVVGYFTSAKKPVSSRIHARCNVRRAQ